MPRQILISRVWVDSQYIYASTVDGKTAKYAFADCRSFANTTDEQRRDFYLSYSGIHWRHIDEDFSFNGMFRDNGFYKDGEVEIFLPRNENF